MLFTLGGPHNILPIFYETFNIYSFSVNEKSFTGKGAGVFLQWRHAFGGRDNLKLATSKQVLQRGSEKYQYAGDVFTGKLESECVWGKDFAAIKHM